MIECSRASGHDIPSAPAGSPVAGQRLHGEDVDDKIERLPPLRRHCEKVGLLIIDHGARRTATSQLDGSCGHVEPGGVEAESGGESRVSAKAQPTTAPSVAAGCRCTSPVAQSFSGPPELVEPVVIDTEVVGDLVDDGGDHLRSGGLWIGGGE